MSLQDQDRSYGRTCVILALIQQIADQDIHIIGAGDRAEIADELAEVLRMYRP